MGAKRRHFTAEFKREVVRRAASGDATVVEVARELGLRSDRVREWVAQANGAVPHRARMGARAPEAAAPEGAREGFTLGEELRRLRRENASLREDLAIVKKAVAFFAKESR
jgi:transposase